MDDNSWIKIYRKSISNPLFQKPLIWHYWEYCLLKANHVDQKIIWNKKEMVIEKGSFITGRKKAAAETGLSEQNIRTALEALSNLGMIVKSTTKSTTKFTYLTVCNYSKYQTSNLPANQQNGHQPTINQPSTNHKQEHIRTLKNKDIYTDKQKAFVGRYIKYISETFKNRAPKSANLENKSLEAINKLIRIDGFQEDYIFEVLRWAQKDDFWKDQILSLAVVRKKSNNGLTKFQNLVTGYEKNKVAENMAKPENTEGTYAHALEQQKAREKNKESIT